MEFLIAEKTSKFSPSLCLEVSTNGLLLGTSPMRLSSLPSTLLWLSIIPTVLSSWSGYRIDKRHDHDNQWANTEVEGIDAGLLAQFKLMSEYAAAAYWPGNNNSTGDLISCSGDSCPTVPEGNCPQVEAANATTVVEFEHGPFDDTGRVPSPLVVAQTIGS